MKKESELIDDYLNENIEDQSDHYIDKFKVDDDSAKSVKSNKVVDKNTTGSVTKRKAEDQNERYERLKALKEESAENDTQFRGKK